MSIIRRSLTVFALVLLYYVILLVSEPLLGRPYRAVFRVCANSVFSSFGSSGRVFFEPLTPPTASKDTEIVLANKAKPGPRGRLSISARLIGYVPLAFLYGLILATPIAWSRRLWALVWGAVLAGGFVAFKLTLELLNAFSDGNVIAIFSFSTFWKTALIIVRKVMIMSPVTAYIVPIFIWMLVCFRKNDFAKFLGLPIDTSRPPSNASTTR